MNRREAFRRTAAAMLGMIVAPLLRKPKPAKSICIRDCKWQVIKSITYYDSEGRPHTVLAEEWPRGG